MGLRGQHRENKCYTVYTVCKIHTVVYSTLLYSYIAMTYPYPASVLHDCSADMTSTSYLDPSTHLIVFSFRCCTKYVTTE